MKSNKDLNKLKVGQIQRNFGNLLKHHEIMPVDLSTVYTQKKKLSQYFHFGQN